ncbi:hypothetical protein L598_000600001400 [Mesorhizobium sp. J18]|uniref:hypothetical protein n=1 Tax=Mesorhizobium sp. J18 TaxID=935263 RepID=UPI00119B5343|nr:hypothetical protein [Mesorhizobium sp. J18]TWG91400.1 hypothetical protein L598_000600001400 [Mesorhizobium sp. J18]
MIRFLFRALATVALALAVVMAVVDATRTIATSALVLTPLGESWHSASPKTFEAAREWLEGLGLSGLWDPALITILALPGFIVFAVLALALYAIGRRPQRLGGDFVRSA